MKKILTLVLIISYLCSCHAKAEVAKDLMTSHNKPTKYDIQMSLEDFCILINKMEQKKTDAHEIADLVEEGIQNKMFQVSHDETENEQHIIYIINPIAKRLGNVKMRS